MCAFKVEPATRQSAGALLLLCCGATTHPALLVNRAALAMTPCQEQHQRRHTDDADGWRPLAQRLGIAWLGLGLGLGFGSALPSRVRVRVRFGVRGLGMAIDELVQHVVRKRALDKLESRLEWERGAG